MSVKLFISYHDKHKIIKSDIIVPIQTGRAVADEVFEGMIGDDTGDNISKDNPRYNELSAQYWVWKNYETIGNPDYVGFMHYRRHFIFDKNFNIKNKSRWIPGINLFVTDCFDKECEDNLLSHNIQQIISENFDCAVVKTYNVKFLPANVYMKDHYLNFIPGSKSYIYDIFYDVLVGLYPQYKELMDSFTYSPYINCFNMFIMKKDLFFEYSEFCFSILKEVDKRIDTKGFNTQELRFLGYLGEYLLTIFVKKLEKDKMEVKYLDGYFISDIDKQDFVHSIQNVIPKKLRRLFSVEKTQRHKIYKFCGIKLKIKRKILHSKDDLIIQMLNEQNIQINRLENKLTELQEELIAKKYKN